MKQVIPGIILCLFLLTACDISGTVTDTTTGEGIEGVMVSIYSSDNGLAGTKGNRLFTAYTDQDGKYQMKSFLNKSKNGEILSVHFSKEGYAFEPETAKVTMDDQSRGVVNAEGMQTP